MKLTDFGHSAVVGDRYSAVPSNACTPLYSAPEVLNAGGPAAGWEFAVDLWSLGVVLYTMLMGACPFGGGCEKLEQEIQRGNFSFWSDGAGVLPGKEAQNLVRSLLRVDPSKRLSLEWCLAHPFVSTSGGLCRQLLRVTGWCDAEVVEDKFQLPGWMPDCQAYSLRQDLQQWMVKFRFAAIMSGPEVIVTYGDEGSLDTAHAAAGRNELLQIMRHHLNARGPSGGNASKVLASRKSASASPTRAVEVPSPQQRAVPVPPQQQPRQERAPLRKDGEEDALLQDDEDEDEARRRRLEARKQQARAGAGPKWNFGGARPGAGGVDGRFREHEAELDRRRRLAFGGRRGFRGGEEDLAEEQQRPVRVV